MERTPRGSEDKDASRRAVERSRETAQPPTTTIRQHLVAGPAHAVRHGVDALRHEERPPAAHPVYRHRQRHGDLLLGPRKPMRRLLISSCINGQQRPPQPDITRPTPRAVQQLCSAPTQLHGADGESHHLPTLLAPPRRERRHSSSPRTGGSRKTYVCSGEIGYKGSATRSRSDCSPCTVSSRSARA